MIAARRGAAAGLASALLALTAGPAAAHGSFAGANEFWSGALHPLVAIEHLILLIALGLLMGPLSVPHLRVALGLLTVGLLAGLALGAGGITVAPTRMVAGSILALGCAAGGLLALGLRPPPIGAMAPLCALAGLAVGLDTDAADSAARISGVVLGVIAIVGNLAALSLWATWSAFPIAARIAGSWIAAITLMLLALTFASQGPAA